MYDFRTLSPIDFVRPIAGGTPERIARSNETACA